jgi:hypothetical protein
LTGIYLENYVKTLVGRNDIEDALKRLEKLTQDEARMVMAENLKATGNSMKEVQQAANNIDQVKRSSSLSLINISSRRLKCHYRETVATGASEVALSTRFFNKSQYRMQFSSRGNSDMVLPRSYLRRMEVDSFPFVDIWKAYAVLTLLPLRTSKVPSAAAGSGKSIMWSVVSQSVTT